MPFGSFPAKERQARPAVIKEKKDKPIPPQPELKPAVVKSTQLNILLVGRSTGLIREFLCSMNQNMSQALHEQGLTYYTRELDTISSMVSTKKKLEQFFWSFSDNDWTYAPEDFQEKPYTFSISPSGNQKSALDLVFTCAVPGQEVKLPKEKTNACWVLADALLLDSTDGYDPFASFAAEAMERCAGKPICLILSQIEKWGHFDQVNDVTVFPKAVSRRLVERCAARFSGTQAAVIPVQIYGGMEYVGTDDAGQPRLHICKDGFYQSYIPENCQIPGMYTLLALSASAEVDFLADAEGNGLRSQIRKHLSQRFGNAGWRPELLDGEEEV